ncbi:MAG: hypothetical protein JWO97_3992 [Acidobacteria bacterium]|nr:hypothetical protein [Acidobacteriota bacterium]
MPFPDHINRIFDAYGVPADTKAAVYDLYVGMGDSVLEAFSDIAESVASPALLRPEDTLSIRERVVETFLRRNHPHWEEGRPTPSLWHPRVTEGRASGLAMPLSDLDLPDALAGDDQSLPDGLLMLGRNAHFGGRQETISFDVVASQLDDAIAIGKAAGQQHTLPGSVGETSGTFDSRRSLALIWEVQPNVYKPHGDRNRAIAKLYRKHRNWHLATLAAAMQWLRAQSVRTYVLRGSALAPTHEVNQAKPVSEMIASLHDRTVATVVGALELQLIEANRDDDLLLAESIVMNTALTKHVATFGSAGAMWRIA